MLNVQIRISCLCILIAICFVLLQIGLSSDKLKIDEYAAILTKVCEDKKFVAGTVCNADQIHSKQCIIIYIFVFGKSWILNSGMEIAFRLSC